MSDLEIGQGVFICGLRCRGRVVCDIFDRRSFSLILINRTRIESPMSEISDEEVDYGSFDSIANPATDSDRAWSPSID